MQGAYTEKQCDTEKKWSFQFKNFFKTWLIKYMKWSYISCKPEYYIGFCDALCTLYHKKTRRTWIRSFVINKRFLSKTLSDQFLKEKI